MNRVCVFCGSSPGLRPEFMEAAELLGRTLAKRNIVLVYGGASVGLMGHMAGTVLDSGGDVVGVIPSSLVEKEVALNDLSDLRIVNSMHERKALMAELSDGFIAMPGGLGTMEEFFEMLTWTQLGIHEKPCALLNVAGYFDKLISFLNEAASQNFIRNEHRSMVLVHQDPEELLNQMTNYEQPNIDKAVWIRTLSNNRSKA